MNYSTSDLKYLRLLAEEYGTVSAASAEIINLNAIQNLPKGTEHFLSDIHGEYEAFNHILRNASGTIKLKIDETVTDMTPEQRAARAAKAAQTRMKSIRRDKIRLHFGLEPLGRLVKRW